MIKIEKNPKKDQPQEKERKALMQKLGAYSSGYAAFMKNVAGCIENYADLIADSTDLVFPDYDPDEGYEGTYFEEFESGDYDEDDAFCEDFYADDEDGFYDDFDDEEEDAIVMYAEPGKAASLVSEEWAIDEMMIYHRVSAFLTRFITDELMAVYPKEYAAENPDGSVFVTGPLYICHPIIDEDDDTNMDLTAVDFCEAMAYLSAHTAKEKDQKNGRIGFLLEKED